MGWAGDAASIAALNSYGTLVQNGDGTWTYTLDNGRAATQGLTAASNLTYTLHYIMTDADGDQSPATLTITIQGATDTASVVTTQAQGPDATVYEAGLNPNGSNAALATETTGGSFTISATDGIQDIVIGGVTFTLAAIQAFGTTNGVVNTGEGVLTLTGYTGTSSGGTVNYSYTLSATIDNDSKVPTGNDTVDADRLQRQRCADGAWHRRLDGERQSGDPCRRRRADGGERRAGRGGRGRRAAWCPGTC